MNKQETDKEIIKRISKEIDNLPEVKLFKKKLNSAFIKLNVIYWTGVIIGATIFSGKLVSNFWIFAPITTILAILSGTVMGSFIEKIE
jgi:hypothetical protein